MSKVMSDPSLVDPEGWEYDLQSVYSAYMGYFQLHSVRWDDRQWGRFFETFERFLAFSWPVITVTDTRTGRAHVVTRMSSVTAFLKMIKTRFGETLPQVDNMLLVKSVEVAQRQVWHVSDGPTYNKLYSTLPTVALAALKTRVRGGDPNAIRELWAMRDKTFFAIDFEFLDRNDRNDRPCVEWGYAAIRSTHLHAAGAWPPVPDTNYRKGHYIISEYAETFNKARPSVSWQFGESQVIPSTKAPRIIQSVLSGLLSPDSETVANNVVLVGHGIRVILQRLEDMEIQLPSNILAIDIAYLERALFTNGERGPMCDRKTGKPRVPESLLSLSGLLYSLEIEPPCVLHNSGNDAFMALVAFQKMVDPLGTVPVVAKNGRAGVDVGGGSRTGKATAGEAHVRRITTVASRIFRPLAGSHPDTGTQKNGNKNVNVSGNGNENENVHEHRNGQGHGSQLHVAERRDKGGADEMGMRRASVFSVLTSPSLAPFDKNKKGRVVNGGNRVSVEVKSGWSSPSTIGPDRRYTIVEKRR